MLVKCLSRIAITVCALFVLNGCLAGADLPGDPIDNPDLGTLVENVALPPPTLVLVVPINPNTETIVWTPVGDPTLKYYIVDRGNTPQTVATLTSVAPNRTSWTSANLTPDTQYCWGLRTVNNLNQVSTRSNILCATTPATPTTPAPTGLVANAISDSRITLTWNPVPNTSVYHVFSRIAGNATFNFLATVVAPATTFTAANLQAGTTYEFQVTAVTINGESPPSNIASATTLEAGLEGYWRFDEDGGGSAADRSGFGRTVSLANASFSDDRAPVRLLTDSIDPNQNRSALSITAAADSQATAATAPAFRFAGGSFAFSGWVNFPTGAAADIVGERAAGCGTLGWKLGQDSTSGLAVQGAGGTFSFGASIPAATWTHVGFSYDSATTTLTTYVNGAQTASGTYAPRSGLTTVPLTFGHVGGCPGGEVLIDEVRILSRPLSAAEVAGLGLRPTPPTLTVTAPFANSQVLTWTAVPGASRFAVYKGTAPGNEEFFTQVVGGGSATSFVGQHLDPLTQYSWFVRVEAGELTSNPSNEVVLSTPDVPAAPANFRVTSTANHAVGLAWDASPSAAVYRISMAGAATAGQAVVAPRTTAVFANLAPGTYQFTILVEDTAQNKGHASAPLSVTVP